MEMFAEVSLRIANVVCLCAASDTSSEEALQRRPKELTQKAVANLSLEATNKVE